MRTAWIGSLRSKDIPVLDRRLRPPRRTKYFAASPRAVGQEALIEALAAFGKPLVVVDCSGRYLPIPAAESHAHALLHAGSLGTEAGTAIARILLGQATPSRSRRPNPRLHSPQCPPPPFPTTASASSSTTGESG